MKLLQDINESLHQSTEQIIAMMDEYERMLGEAEQKAKQQGKPLFDYIKEQIRGGMETEPAAKARAGEMEWRRGLMGEPESPALQKREPEKVPAPTGPEKYDTVVVRGAEGMARYRIMDKKNTKVGMEKIRAGFPGEERMPKYKTYDLVFTNFKPGTDPQTKKPIYFVKD